MLLEARKEAGEKVLKAFTGAGMQPTSSVYFAALPLGRKPEIKPTDAQARALTNKEHFRVSFWSFLNV